MNRESSKLARALVKLLTEKGLTVATAESCTGGGIAAALTSISGSSACVRGGIVAYATEVKQDVLQVSPATICGQGVVSEQTVCEMALGAAKVLKADIGVSTSGVTGPTGGTEENPVGTVWMAVASMGGPVVTFRLSEGDAGRARNTQNAINKALVLLLDYVKKQKND